MSKSLLQRDMFSSPKPPIDLYASWYSEVDHRALLHELQPVQYEYLMYGKSGPRPRLERWLHQDRARTYRFGGGDPIQPVRFGPLVATLVADVMALTGERYDSCFANYYRTGQDYIDWHADDEDWIGPHIASVSFGGSRVMQFRRKTDHTSKYAITLNHGDLLLMLPGCQDEWEHTVRPKSGRCRPRLNLTIRQTWLTPRTAPKPPAPSPSDLERVLTPVDE